MKNGKIWICVAALVIVLGLFAGCGGKDKGAAPAESAGSAPAAAEQSGGTDPAIQKAVDEAQSAVDEMQEAVAGVMEIGVSARGNAVVYTYTYTMDIDKATAADALKTAADAQADAFNAAAKALVDSGVADASVIVEYLAQDGTMLYSQEYKG